MWRNKELKGEMVRKKFTGIHREIGIKRAASNKIKDIWPKIVQYVIKYKEIWERLVKEWRER
jgi:hypothetical protein